MPFDLTYSHKNIVRTVAVGFTLGSLVLSVGYFVILFSLALLDVEPFTLRTAVVNALWAPVVLVFLGVILGWIVRIGLGLHAWWRYRRSERRLDHEDIDT